MIKIHQYTRERLAEWIRDTYTAQLYAPYKKLTSDIMV